MEPALCFQAACGGSASNIKAPAKYPKIDEGADSAMAKKNVADLLVDTLAGAGVQRIYRVSGDSLNGITD